MKKGNRSESSLTPPVDPQSTIPPLDPSKDPSKAPMESSLDPTPPWDPKYHFEALSKHFQRQHQALSDKIDDLVHAFERTKTTPTITQVIRGPARHNERQNEPEEEYYDENTDAGYETPDRGRDRPHPPNRRVAYNDDYGEDRMLNNIKINIPEFEGLHDPDVYLDWERKVEKIFACYDFTETKKVQLACLEFRGYAATWWEMQQERRRRNRNPPIDNWEEMKGFLRGRFIPVHYERELEKKLNRSNKAPVRLKTPSRARDIQCHKCQGWGHFQNQCPNRRVLFLNEHNGLESASEDEEEPQAAAPDAADVSEVEQDDEEPELPHVSLVSIRSLNINREDEEQSQRENIFYTRVAIKDQTCAMVIDSGSMINAISQYAVDKLALTTTKHPKPYKLQWLTDRGSICVTGQVHISFTKDRYSDTILCYVIPMEAAHILVERPWQFDRQAIHDGLANTYSITRDGRTIVLKPLTPKAVAEDQERMQERFKQERTKTAAAAARTSSAATSPPCPTTSLTNTAPKMPFNDSLVRGKASGSAPSKEKNWSMFISVKGVEKALKAGLPFVLLSYKDSATNGVSLPCDMQPLMEDKEDLNPELQFKGPVTRLRAKKLQDYLQATVRKKLEEEDSVQDSSKLMTLLMLEDGDQDMEYNT
ncbi:hypothetical protein C2S53_005470 [Perilla frutescens var. hirtella]|uniref:Retrotransposon gag domain-containing protein n=1 Tax=Perilla frutescens var. hirtella TaxID=608512 RepID=A0AAD4JGD8_PERFH|nr:hypothetical protein C2S53_005470 [Perilla frutescens var. hirtella]